MAKIIPMVLIESMSGKVCSHSDTYFAVRNGTQYTGTLCNKRTSDYSASEIANQTKFKTAQANAVERFHDTSKIAEDKAAFAKQSKYKTLLGYLVAAEYAKLNN